METIEHGQEVFVMVGSNGPGHRKSAGTVGVSSVYGADHEDRLRETKEGRAKLKEILQVRKDRGDAEVWVNQHCSVIDNSGLTYNEKYPERLKAIEVQHDTVYLVVNRKGTKNKWVAWVIGDYSSTVHFYRPNDPALQRRRDFAERQKRDRAERRLLALAQDGNRLSIFDKASRKDKTIWAGLGDRHGLHGYADTVLREKWDKSGERFTKKIGKLPSGTKVAVLDFRQSNGMSRRNQGHWVCDTTVVLP